ncbi:MAG: hypothetical protein Q4F83_15910 [Eubacteriales bacterium]|nr:hypothetical protein [Eubacteriales bacterium]
MSSADGKSLLSSRVESREQMVEVDSDGFPPLQGTRMIVCCNKVV